MGRHGRDVCTRVVIGVLTSAALAAQTPGRYQELLADLAGKIATTLAGAPASASGDSPDADDARSVDTALAGLLAARGIRIVPPSADLPAVRVVCSENLRERVCTADVRKGAAPSEVVMVTRPLAGEGAADGRGAIALDLQPLFSQPAPILDLVRLETRLLVLDHVSIALYEPTVRGWQPRQTWVLPVSRPWPRDVRGRLQIAEDRLEAFLPGLTCTGRLNETMLACAPGARAWPLGIDNGGLPAGTNAFTTPGGRAFFSAAPLGADADARWLVADRDGTLVWLDAAQRSVGVAGRGDDVARLRSCVSETRLLVASRAEGRDALRAFQASRGRLVPITPSVPVSGTLTALWPVPDASSAIAVVHDAAAGRHEAFLANLPCAR